MMDPLARMWAEKRLKQLQLQELRRSVCELKQLQNELHPLIVRATELRHSNMRQDGPFGFVMVQKGGRDGQA